MCDTSTGALAIAAEVSVTGGGREAGGQDVRDFGKFLRMLEVHFEGRRCSLGLYKPLRDASSEERTLGDTSGADVTVGSVIVTLEPPERLVLGAFVEGAQEGGGTKEWAYWEGVFGPTELADHRESLGWEGEDPVKSLTDCFARAIEGTHRFNPPVETKTSSPPTPAGAANGTLSNSRKSPENNSADSQPSPASDKPGVVTTDDCQQQPPEISRGQGAEGDGQEGSSTLDLHYADPDIVGSWRVRLVQGGLSDGLVVSMQRTIYAASALPNKNADKELGSPKKGETSSSGPSRGKRRGGSVGLSAQPRQRRPAKGATLVGTQPSPAEA